MSAGEQQGTLPAPEQKRANAELAARREQGRLVKVLLAGSALRLIVMLLFPQFVEHHLAGRVELSTPVTSYKQLVEGLYLSSHGISPFDGGVFHQSPLLLLLFKLPYYLPEIVTSLMFILADAAVALVLAKIAGARHSLSHFTQQAGVPGEQAFVCSPPVVAMLYLFNPLMIGTTVVKSTIVFSHLAVVLALYMGMHGNINMSVVWAAVATHLSLYPAMLVVPIALMAGKRQPLRSAIVQTVGKFAVAVLTLHLVFSAIFGKQYFLATFDFTLRVADLQPNVGLFWYFFIEIFDEFRSFFFVVFQLTALAFAVPVSWRFRREPAFGAIMLVGVISALKAYPSWGDLALFLGLLPVYEELFKYLQYSFLFGNLLMYGIGLAPVFWHLWIEQGSGNANFFYAATLVYEFGQITMLFDFGSAMLRRELDISEPETRTHAVIQE